MRKGNRKLNNKGFTLIEIIVVLLILTILMSVMVPSVMSYMGEANSARDIAYGRAVMINAQAELPKAMMEAEDGGMSAPETSENVHGSIILENAETPEDYTAYIKTGSGTNSYENYSLKSVCIINPDGKAYMAELNGSWKEVSKQDDGMIKLSKGGLSKEEIMKQIDTKTEEGYKLYMSFLDAEEKATADPKWAKDNEYNKKNGVPEGYFYLTYFIDKDGNVQKGYGQGDKRKAFGESNRMKEPGQITVEGVTYKWKAGDIVQLSFRKNPDGKIYQRNVNIGANDSLFWGN